MVMCWVIISRSTTCSLGPLRGLVITSMALMLLERWEASGGVGGGREEGRRDGWMDEEWKKEDGSMK